VTLGQARAPDRRALALIVIPIVVLIAAAYVGDALWPTLVEDHPLWLLGLNARNRYVVLVANRVGAPGYYGVGSLRLLAPDPFFFLLGWFYGDAAVRWMERRTPTFGRMLRQLEGLFGRWGYPLVVFAPNNFVCLLAGASGMSPLVFAALDIVGTIGRLFVLQIVGDIFSGPIDWLLGLVKTYRIPLLVISIVAVAFTVWRETRRSAEEIEQLRSLEGDADDEDEDDPVDPVA